MKVGVSRTKRAKRLRSEINVIRRKISIKASMLRKKKNGTYSFGKILESDNTKGLMSDKVSVPSANLNRTRMKIKQDEVNVSQLDEVKVKPFESKFEETKVKSEPEQSNIGRTRGKMKETEAIPSADIKSEEASPRNLTRNRAKIKEPLEIDTKLEITKQETNVTPIQTTSRTRGKLKDSVSEVEDVCQSRVKFAKNKEKVEPIVEKEKKVVRTQLRRAAKDSLIQNANLIDTDDEKPVVSPIETAFAPPSRNLRNHPVGISEDQNETFPSPAGKMKKGPKGSLKNKTISPPPPSLIKPNKSAVNVEPAISSNIKSQKPPSVSSLSPRSQKCVSPPVLKPQISVTNQTENIETKKGQKCDTVSNSTVSPRTRRSMVTRRESLKDVSSETSEPETDRSTEEARETRSKSARAQNRSQSENDVLAATKKGPRKNRSTSLTVEGELTSSKKKPVGLSSSVSVCSNPFSSTPLPQTDSFKVYRSNNQDHGTDSDNNTESSSASTPSSSSSSSEGQSDSDSDGEDHKSLSRKNKNRDSMSEFNAEEQQHLIELQPLDLVWAKCRGYPWYPALIINPSMPKTECFHNGVPIPVPPEDVLALKVNYEENVYLVLFFDTKRTWQWLPRNKLEPLGVDTKLDKARLVESKKAAERKAVKKAFENAILHRCRVTGESNIMSNESDEEI